MEKLHTGLFIRQKRLEKDWSQEGLCRGICSVSYLSKIEQGKADASPEVLHLLLEKLGIVWHDSPEELAAARNLREQLYEMVFSMRPQNDLAQQLESQWDTLVNGPCFVDFLLLKTLTPQCGKITLPRGCEEHLNPRQRSLWLIYRNEWDELGFSPFPMVCYMAGYRQYVLGNNTLALEYLQRACRMAAEEGYAHVMLLCYVTMGNCYNNTRELRQMEKHYTIARRLAQDLHRDEILRGIDYNLASSHLECGDTAAAYGYFSALTAPGIMDLHKLAICCEKLGRRQEALAALDKTAFIPFRAETEAVSAENVRWMLALVRYRLEHPGYLQEESYGKLLLKGFANFQKEAPNGFVLFHLPYVQEWYVARGQYRQAYELLRDFPDSSDLKQLEL